MICKQQMKDADMKSIYESSKKLEVIPGLTKLPSSLMVKLIEADPKDRLIHGQKIIDKVCKLLSIPSVKLKVLDKPQLHRNMKSGKLKSKTLGLYWHIGKVGKNITIYNLTAKTQKIVSGKVFFHTLLHEICHHIDCAKFGFTSSPHTSGFYSRINDLYKKFS